MSTYNVYIVHVYIAYAGNALAEKVANKGKGKYILFNHNTFKSKRHYYLCVCV